MIAKLHRYVFRTRISYFVLMCGIAFSFSVQADAPLSPYQREHLEIFGPAKQIKTLLKEKKFAEAKTVMEMPGLDSGVLALTLEELGRIPLYATDGKCRTGESKYEGREVEELLDVVMKRYDVNDTFHGKFRRNASTSSFLDGLFGLTYRSPACFSKEHLSQLISLMLNKGFDSHFFGEEYAGSYESRFSSIMFLGDRSLANRILRSGITIDRKDWKFLFARAPTMEMVRLLESHKYVLTQVEYRELFELQKKAPDTFLKSAQPDVVEYYKSKLN